MKKLFRYIRHRICRNIYYADYCPIDNRKNYHQMFENSIAALGLALSRLCQNIWMQTLCFPVILFCLLYLFRIMRKEDIIWLKTIVLQPKITV